MQHDRRSPSRIKRPPKLPLTRVDDTPTFKHKKDGVRTNQNSSNEGVDLQEQNDPKRGQSLDEKIIKGMVNVASAGTYALRQSIVTIGKDEDGQHRTAESPNAHNYNENKLSAMLLSSVKEPHSFIQLSKN